MPAAFQISIPRAAKDLSELFANRWVRKIRRPSLAATIYVDVEP